MQVTSPGKTSAYAYQLFNEHSGALDFRVDFYDSDLVNTSFAAQTFSRYDFYTIIWLYNGSGRFQVDFQYYNFADAKMIFLTPGQYFNVESGQFKIIRYSFTQQFFCVAHNQLEALCNGVLYNHLYAVASIEVGQKEQQKFQELHLAVLDAFRNYFVADHQLVRILLSKMLAFATHSWKTQSPLNPEITAEETNLLFKLKAAIEQYFRQQLTMADYAKLLGASERSINRLLKKRLGMRISDLLVHRQILEAKRELYFTAKAIKEVAIDLGFADPSYFNRFFKKHTGKTPMAFRKKHGVKHLDESVAALTQLIEQHYKEHHHVHFYADQLHLTPRTLSDIIKRVFNKTVGELIKLRLTLEAKRQLFFSDKNVKDIAFELGFEDPAYFSHFFKNATTVSPEAFRAHWQSLGPQPPQMIHLEFGLFNWMKKGV